MIEFRGAARRYGALTALHPLDLVIEPGVVVGLLGANGAGKTTALNVLVTLLEPTAGSVLVGGIDARVDPLGVRRLIGHVPEHAAVYEGLTADEYLELAAEVRGLDADTWRPRADRLLAHLGLTDARGRRLGTFSKGMRSKAVLAAALLHDPRVLVLDEPLDGLDVEGQRLVTGLMREMAEGGRTVVYSSHVLEQVERACDVLVLLHRGRLLWQGRVDDLRAKHGGLPLPDVFLRMTATDADRGAAKATWSQLLSG